MPNPDSGLEVVALGEGKTLLIYNNSHIHRYPLTIALSDDYGTTWTPLCDIESDLGEFPSAILDSQGLLHIIYAWTPAQKTQRQIKHLILDPKKLL